MSVAAGRLCSQRRAAATAVFILALVLAGAVSARNALASPAVAIGTNSERLPAQANVAVDPAGTAYIAWSDQAETAMNFCKLPVGAVACSPQQLALPGGSKFIAAHPSVLLEGERVYVFAEVVSANTHENGVVGFVSSNGGGTFSQLLGGAAISYSPGNSESTLNPVIALPGGNIGVGYVIPLANPSFQAVSLSSPVESSQAGHGPAGSLNPSPDSYAIGNLGGQLAAQLSGVEGVLGAFELIEAGPCPATDGIAYAFAPLPATNAALNTATGAGSAWDPLQSLECNADYSAVAGGPSGLGVLDEDETTGAIVYHRFDPSTDTFLPSVTVAAQHETSAALSQDGSGHVYASWVDGTELDLDYSANGGASWPTPVKLVDAGASSIGGAWSAVDGAGQGWAVYAVGTNEYALPFTATTVTSPGSTSTVSQSTTFEGEHTTLSAPAQCVRNGVIKGDLTVKIPSHTRKGQVVVKIYKVIFTLGSTHKTISRRKLSNAPFVAVLHVKGLARGKKYELFARAFIAVHHGPPRSKTLHVLITTCA